MKNLCVNNSKEAIAHRKPVYLHLNNLLLKIKMSTHFETSFSYYHTLLQLMYKKSVNYSISNTGAYPTSCRRQLEMLQYC